MKLETEINLREQIVILTRQKQTLLDYIADLKLELAEIKKGKIENEYISRETP